jgi:hypothetical protein
VASSPDEIEVTRPQAAAMLTWAMLVLMTAALTTTTVVNPLTVLVKGQDPQILAMTTATTRNACTQ